MSPVMTSGSTQLVYQHVHAGGEGYPEEKEEHRDALFMITGPVVKVCRGADGWDGGGN